MPQLTETKLKERLAADKLDRFYFLYGEEQWFIHFYMNRIIDAVLEDDNGFNLARFNYSKMKIDELYDAVNTLPVFTERKCVVLSDFDAESADARQTGDIVSLIADAPPETVFIMAQNNVSVNVKKSAKWKKFIGKISDYGSVTEFSRKTNAELKTLVCAYAKKGDCSITPDMALYLINRCGYYMRTLATQIDKLCACADGGNISVEMIDSLTTKTLEASVFDIAKFLQQGDTARAVSALDTLLGNKEEPIAILAVLSGAYVDLYRVKAAAQAAVPVGDIAKNYDYRGKEFRIKNAERACRFMPMDAVKACLDALERADTAMKSTAADKQSVIRRAVIECGQNHT